MLQFNSCLWEYYFFTKQNINNTNPLNFAALDLKVIIYSNKIILFIQTKVLDLFKKVLDLLKVLGLFKMLGLFKKTLDLFKQ
jgi:hypothetical protein